METVDVEIILNDGRKMIIELYPETAPLTVRNFLSLTDEGFYDGLCFHRIIENFMIQGGGFVHDKNLIHKPAPSNVKGEFMKNGVRNLMRHTAGVISMARTPDMDSASSQFFICVADCPFLNGDYAAFGKTKDADSLRVAMDVSKVRTRSAYGFDDVPAEPVTIKTIRRIKNANHTQTEI